MEILTNVKDKANIAEFDLEKFFNRIRLSDLKDLPKSLPDPDYNESMKKEYRIHG
jgi:hypothetical protein